VSRDSPKDALLAVACEGRHDDAVRVAFGLTLVALVGCSSTSNNGDASGGTAGAAGAAGGGGGGTGGATGGASGTGGALGGGGGAGGSGTGGIAGAGGSSYCGPIGKVVGTICQLGKFATGDDGVAIALDDTYVWWATLTGVRRMRKDATGMVDAVSSSLAAGYHVGGLALDGSRVCWTEENGAAGPGFVRCRGTDLGQPAATLASTEVRPTTMAADGTWLFWANEGSGTTGNIRKVATGAASGATDVVTSSSVFNVVTDATEPFVYYASGATIRRAGKDANTGAQVFAPNWSPPRLIALSKNYVYFPQSTGIYRVLRKANATETQTSAAVDLTALTIQDETVYWGRKDNSITYELVDTDGETQLPALGVPAAIAVDADSIYWVSKNPQGYLAKTKK